MHCNILPLILFDMDLNLCLFSSLLVLKLGPDHVVGRSWGHALRELSAAVGDEFPLGFLLVGAADLDPHTLDRALLSVEDCAEDQRIIRMLLLAGERTGGQQQDEDERELSHSSSSSS